MFKFISKTLHHPGCSAARAAADRNLYFLQIHPLSTSSSSSSLKPIQNSPDQHSFTVNYLVNSCGLSPEEAILASKHLKFEAPHKPDSVLAFLKDREFTKSQISAIVRTCPKLLLCDTQKTLFPKLEFLESKGFSRGDVAKKITVSPVFLKSSLANKIIPNFDFFCDLLGSEEKTIAAIKRYCALLFFHLQTMKTNIDVLRDAHVPNANIIFLLTSQPRSIMTSTNKLRHVVEEVEKMGITPSSKSFVLAVCALRAVSKSTLEKKVEIYKKWGCTKDEIFVAFKKYPCCMRTSEDKINRVMEFFVNEMGWESSFVATRPALTRMSLEKRIVPRSAIYQALLSKGLIKTTDIGLMTLLQLPEMQFLKKVLSYTKEEGPEILALYKEKLDLAK